MPAQDPASDPTPETGNGGTRSAATLFQSGLLRMLMAWGRWMPVEASQGLGRLLGGALYRLAGPTRNTCLDNLAQAFPELAEPERAALARENFRNVGMVLLEFFSIDRMRKQPGRWVAVEGEEILRAAQARGPGAVVAMAHLGNWELQAIAFERMRLKVGAVGRFIVNPWINRRILALRESEFFRVIRQESAESSRDLLKTIKNGGILVTYVDLDTHGPGVFVDFFGRPACTPRGAAAIALRNGLPLLTGFGERRSDGTHVFRFQEVVLPPGLTNTPEGVREATQVLTRQVEQAVRERPAQWIWFHKRWRRRPGKDGRPVTEGS